MPSMIRDADQRRQHTPTTPGNTAGRGFIYPLIEYIYIPLLYTFIDLWHFVLFHMIFLYFINYYYDRYLIPTGK